MAEKTLRKMFPEARISGQITKRQGSGSLAYETDSSRTLKLMELPASRIGAIKHIYRPFVEEEAVQHLDDLIFRRTTLWENPKDAIGFAPFLCELFPWNTFRCREEIERLTRKLTDGRSPQSTG